MNERATFAILVTFQLEQYGHRHRGVFISVHGFKPVFSDISPAGGEAGTQCELEKERTGLNLHTPGFGYKVHGFVLVKLTI